jgi:hypothetical protein
MNLDQHISEIAEGAGRKAFMESHDEAVLNAIAKYDTYNTCLTRQECADYLNVTYNTVGAHIQKGNIIVNAAGTIPKVQFLNGISFLNKKASLAGRS